MARAGVTDPVHRTSYTLAILRRRRDGQLVIARNANMLADGVAHYGPRHTADFLPFAACSGASRRIAMVDDIATVIPTVSRAGARM